LKSKSGLTGLESVSNIGLCEASADGTGRDSRHRNELLGGVEIWNFQKEMEQHTYLLMTSKSPEQHPLKAQSSTAVALQAGLNADQVQMLLCDSRLK